MAERIVAVVPEYSDRVGRIRHTLAFLLNVIPIILITTVIGLVTGRLSEMWIALAAFGLLRQTSGGIHLGSSEMCIIVTTVGATLLSFSDFSLPVVHTMTAISVLIVLVFAPSRIEGRTLFPKRYFRYLRVISTGIVSINFIVQSPIIAAAFLAQSIMLFHLKGGKVRHA
ncbi:accessory regulator AgrB [Paenibacillus sp. 1011MAR3C5]|uniref:accessory gene regulator B family protein n=1 Tax=Paenibacillus sp. 1011MAR3C5 TaxID=1675787 RepID=UPI000E6C2FCC|nr:accessory gene regulator B family protein [Paenibacillus sp. 1011MAR3C5]RJE90632.1 accessory regulator AgrB [Paenibacillus sp. 1011MAR3C5]